MIVYRLSWAGVKIVSARATLLIDALGQTARLAPFMGPPVSPPVPVAEPGSVDLAIITHQHPDHFDPRQLEKLLRPGGKVLCHRRIEAEVAAAGLPVMAATLFSELEFEEFRLMAVPAVDGLGDDQVSWIVEGENKRLIHCGDTLWHGYWWRIARLKGPFDLAFLPINGVVTAFEGMTPSGMPASLTPEQAASAAHVLRAKTVCPIHYGLFHHPPVYAQTRDAETRFLAAAGKFGLNVSLVPAGEKVAM